MAGYELIGTWKVSARLPQEARDSLGAYFSAMRDRRIPLPTIFSRDDLLFHFTGFHIPPTTTKADVHELINKTAPERLIPGIASSFNDTYLEHRAAGGSIGLPENPFVPYGNLYGGANLPPRDFKTKPPIQFGQSVAPNPLVVKDGVTVFSDGSAWWRLDAVKGDGEQVLRAWKEYGFPVPGEAFLVKPVQTFMFNAVMDWKNLEARIEPLLQKK